MRFHIQQQLSYWNSSLIKDTLSTSRCHHNGALDQHGTVTMWMPASSSAGIACLILLACDVKADPRESYLSEGYGRCCHFCIESTL
jgi:hypothetical protein